MRIWLIINGKATDDPALQEAIRRARAAGVALELKVTQSGEDVERFIGMAVERSIRRIVIGGGDGTLHDAVNALMRHPAEQRPEMGIVPMGTANDFATSTGIPLTPMDALSLATDGEAFNIDVGCINDLHFINLASGGFGARVTSTTPPKLKKMLGGGAYSLVGAMRAWRFQPFEGRLILSDRNVEASLIVLSIGNGRQAGGGQELAPKALLDDGLLDVLAVESFPLSRIGQAIRELNHLSDQGSVVRYYQLTSMQFDSRRPLPVNLDGEAHEFTQMSISIRPGALAVILPEECPLLSARAGSAD
ncbi:lipid kinase YegS [Kushneria sinocarnis]|uniref:Lipid kinase YegS n=1 Tax=Kushneria sinocarnis TaxID=595502 RepID=A0A420WUT0_9GAMM|nr:lipid kinase YegS [Kushneria sinocarnis]RKQ97201.1 lipid kinase YegS [Kushneria sinocarnis]